METNHQAAASTESPTVSSPWLRSTSALPVPSAEAMRRPSSASTATPVYVSYSAWSS